MKLKQDEPSGTIEKRATQEVQDLMTARWVADMIGVAAELQLADFINAGAKTAEEIAKAKGLHPISLYRLLRGLASYGIFAEQGGWDLLANTDVGRASEGCTAFCVGNGPADNQALVGTG